METVKQSKKSVIREVVIITIGAMFVIGCGILVNIATAVPV